MPVRINGSTSGYVELAAPAVAGSTSLTLPLTGFGKVLQIQHQPFTTSNVNTTSTTAASIGHQVSITPNSTSSKILLFAQSTVMTNASQKNYILEIRHDSSATVVAKTMVYEASLASNPWTYPMTLIGVHSPSSTSAQTYSVYHYVQSGGSGSYCVDGLLSNLVAVEIGP